MRFAPIFAPFLAASLLAAPRPKLVVVISVDQFSAELMSRWGQDLPGGLGRLQREGTAFVETFHDHGYTETGPGHSVLLTGCHPMHTGITENSWRDRARGRDTYCVEDPASPLVDVAGTPVSPANLRTGTLGEWLTAQVPGSRSFAVTGKDRSAILMAGHRAQGVYWFNGAGGFTTSKAYASTLPPWLKAYNTRFLTRLADESLFWSPLDGRPLPPSATYTVHGAPVTLGLPRSVHAVGMPLDADFWGRFRATPFFDEAILGAARALEDAEHLGQGPGTDLLALGLSATDYIGHRFGNGGPEMLDALRRLDKGLGAYLDHLAAKVPGLWVVLTADHGAADFPERLQAQGYPARRVYPGPWAQALNLELRKRLGLARDPFLPADGPMLYLDPALTAPAERKRILDAAVALAKATPEVADAFTAEDLAAYAPDPQEPPARRGYKAKLRLSFVQDRSGDLLVAYKPFYYKDDPKDLATHGHPQDTDRRVPLIFWGPWQAARVTDEARTVDLAPTLAAELGIHPAEPVDGHPLALRVR
ncbi:alkaline phosphatase family protein [Mesoterricola silvestris]|uniref:Alkaline phosphatase n=1 Tax=Mesoterricola silvestris TaxID=2927979 RepID=A0AA48K9C3_9BACT|nr:alkaline phosphatase family protein [Mesoterricola silvestris]BDU73296.1 alkaline phosphatase [Mesoterricola silvestris]